MSDQWTYFDADDPATRPPADGLYELSVCPEGEPFWMVGHWDGRAWVSYADGMTLSTAYAYRPLQPDPCRPAPLPASFERLAAGTTEGRG